VGVGVWVGSEVFVDRDRRRTADDGSTSLNREQRAEGRGQRAESLSREQKR
jgi:hypothetical protein